MKACPVFRYCNLKSQKADKNLMLIFTDGKPADIDVDIYPDRQNTVYSANALVDFMWPPNRCCYVAKRKTCRCSQIHCLYGVL